jgi:signal recognition particle subunit SRP54
MFTALTDRLNDVFRKISGRGIISEENIREAVASVRTALLEADVNFQVVKEFCDTVQANAMGQEVISSLQPGQLFIKSVYDELVKLMGPVDTSIMTVTPGPTVIMMCGLQGAGKTTTCGKLARYLDAKGLHPLMVAADLQRPAAVEQLRVLGEQVGVPVYIDETKVAEHGQVPRGAAVAVCRAAVADAKLHGHDVVIIDTAGRLHIDEDLMTELRDINTQIGVHQIFLVLDAMSGQDAVNSAKAFNDQLELDGLILTKFDSDTRGGALLSAKYVTGKPVKFIGVGEKVEGLEEFRPEGMAQRILGMGDVVGLVNDAMQKFDAAKTAKINEKMLKGQLSLDDFMDQMAQVGKLGSVGRVMNMLPGMDGFTRDLNIKESDMDKQVVRMRAIYNSMSKKERKDPDMLDGPRRRRIATGAGVQTQDVSQFIKQFETSRDLMQSFGSLNMARKMSVMSQLMSGGLVNLAGSFGLKGRKSTFMEKKDRNKKKRR